MSKNKTFIKIVVIFSLIIILFGSFFHFVQQISDMNTQKILNHLEDVGKETANIYNLKFKSLQNVIVSTAEILGRVDHSDDEIGNILDTVAQGQELFQRIWYIDKDKTLHNYKKDIILEDHSSYIDEVFNGHTGFTNPLTSLYDNKSSVVIVYTPIYKNNQVVGGLAGIVEVNNESHDYIYNDVFNDEAYVFATSADGQIISKIKNNNTLYFGDNYFDFLNNNVYFMNSNYKSILHNIQKNQSGFASYRYKNDERMIYYTPVKINNWYIFNIISNDIIDDLNDQMNGETLKLILEIIFDFVVMLFILIRYFIKINKMNEETNNQLRTSNKKIEMILKQTSDRIFEYDIDNDSLILDAWNDYPKIILNSFLSNLHNYNFVSKEHEKLLKEKFHEIINNKDKIVFDAKLPYISRDDETWFHVSMIYVNQNKRLIGTLRNSTTEMNEYNLLLQDQMFKNSVYSNALFMFAVNLKSQKVVIYQKNGIYHNVIDVQYENSFLKSFVEEAAEKDRERVAKFFSQENVQNIYHHNGKRTIEFRTWKADKNRYEWVKFRIQFERQSSNNELLMIAYSNDINDEKSRQLEYEYKAQRDGLTGLYNRQTFNQFVDDYLKDKKSVSDYCAYMIVDLDNFKSINDSLGHSTGDEVIQKVATLLESICFNSGYVGRFGGDEFVIFLYAQESYAEIENKAREIIRRIEGIKMDSIHDITASIGITFVTDEKHHRILFDKSDQALYVSKKSGKCRYYVYVNEK